MMDNPFADLIPQQMPQQDDGGFVKNLGIGARGLVKSVGAIPDLLATPANIALGLQGKAPLLTASEDLGKAFDYVTGNRFQPQGFGENALGTAAEFVGGGAGIAKAGATKASEFATKYLAPQTAGQYASLGAAGAGLEAGKQLDPGGVVAPIAGSLLGAFAPGAALKGLSYLGAPIKNTQNALAGALGVNPEKFQSFENAGLSPTLGDVSDSRFIKGAQNVILEAPFSGYKISDAIKKTNEAIDSRLSGGIAQDEAGSLAQSGLRNYQKRGSDVAGRLQQRMATHLVPDEAIPVNKTLQAIGGQTKFSTPEAQAQFSSSALGKEYTKLGSIAERNNGSIPYQDLVYFRQNIDDQINNFGLMGFSKEQGALKNLRTQIQGDIGEAFKGKGPQAGRDFERFNKFYTQFARKNEDVINGLLKDKTATQAFRSIASDLRLDAGKANTVLKTLNPEQKQVFSQSLVRELGMNPQNEFSPSYFATNFKKLEPNAQEVLLAPYSKETRTQMRSIVDAIDNMKETKAISNPSGSFNQAFRGGALIGAVTNPVSTGALLLGANASAKLMTNPKFIGWLARAPGLKTVEEVGSHISKLERIANVAPQLTPDIQQYLSGLGRVEEVASESPKSNTNNVENPFEDLVPQSPTPSQSQPQPQPQMAPQSSVNSELLDKIAMMESGGNPNAHAQGSSASGMYQFTNPTWKDAVARYGSETGVRLQDKNNPRAQRIIAEKMLKDSAADLKNFLGREAQPTEIYLTHFLGLGGAKKLLGSNPRQFAAAVLPEAARANRSVFFKEGRPLTVAEVYSNFNRKISSRKV